MNPVQDMTDDAWSQLYLKITLLQVSRNNIRNRYQMFISWPPGRRKGRTNIGEEAESEDVQKSQFQADQAPDRKCGLAAEEGDRLQDKK